MRGNNRRRGRSPPAGGADEFTGSDGGKTRHYMVRWLSTRGEAGPLPLEGLPRTKSAVAQRRGLTACQGWSETVSATVGA